MKEFSSDPDREHLVGLPDGRTLAIAEYGPQSGRPVVFIAGAGSSRHMNAHGAAARARDVRMITFDRPGLGRSTPHPDKTLATVAIDVGHALRHLGVERPAAIANSQGAPFGLAAAGAGLFSRLALVSPADEIAHPAIRAMLPEESARFVSQIDADPNGMARFLSGFDAAGLFDFVMSGASASDDDVFADPDFVALFRRALDEGFAQGGAGYAQDTLLASRRWDLPEGLRTPVRIWFGADDRSHSPDLGATMAQRFGATRTTVEGVGGALLWTRTGDILDRLLE